MVDFPFGLFSLPPHNSLVNIVSALCLRSSSRSLAALYHIEQLIISLAVSSTPFPGLIDISTIRPPRFVCWVTFPLFPFFLRTERRCATVGVNSPCIPVRGSGYASLEFGDSKALPIPLTSFRFRHSRYPVFQFLTPQLVTLCFTFLSYLLLLEKLPLGAPPLPTIFGTE